MDFPLWFLLKKSYFTGTGILTFAAKERLFPAEKRLFSAEEGLFPEEERLFPPEERLRTAEERPHTGEERLHYQHCLTLMDIAYKEEHQFMFRFLPALLNNF